MTYQTALPTVFSYTAVVSALDAIEIAIMLVNTSTPYTDDSKHSSAPVSTGSSFAVTTDMYPITHPNCRQTENPRRVWLSNASHSRVTSSQRWPHITWSETRG